MLIWKYSQFAGDMLFVSDKYIAVQETGIVENHRDRCYNSLNTYSKVCLCNLNLQFIGGDIFEIQDNR